MKRTVLVTIGLLLGLVPAAHGGQPAARPAGSDAGLTLRLGGDARVEADQSVDALVVVGGSADVVGTVNGPLVVLGGRAHVEGEIRDDLVVVSGRLTLGPHARVGGDVSLLDSPASIAEGAAIAGRVHQSSDAWPSRSTRLTLWAVLSLTTFLIALVFAWLGLDPLERSRAQLSEDLGGSALGAVAVWLGAPVAALLSALTVIGLPLALTLLGFVLPTLWFLGYVVAATTLGAWLNRGLRPATSDRGHWPPALALGVGLLVLQSLALAPVLGPLIVLLAGQLGAGAIVRQAWRRRRRLATRPAAQPPSVRPPFELATD